MTDVPQGLGATAAPSDTDSAITQPPLADALVLTPSSDDGGLESRVELLRDEVGLLQISVAERQRPWYRTPSTLISILALLCSAIFSVQTLLQAHYASEFNERSKADAELKAKRETLRQLMVQVSDIRSDEIQEQSSLANSNPALFALRSGARNSKRHILLESADAIASEILPALSANVLVSLGFEHLMDSSFRDAERYYTLSLSHATSDVTRIAAFVGLCNVYMMPGGPLHDLRKGRDFARRALALLGNRGDEYARQQRVESYMQLAWEETVNGNVTESARWVRAAREEVARMSTMNPARGQFESTIGTYYDNSGMPVKPADHVDSLMRTLSGEWVVSFAGQHPLIGHLHVFIAPQAGATMEVSDGAVLVRKYAGSVVAEGARVVRIDWVGSRFHPMAGVVGAAGVTRLRLECTGRVNCGTEEAVGEAASSFTFARN